jgi:uncharacterized phage infection (PIP) family protein YhgE
MKINQDNVTEVITQAKKSLKNANKFNPTEEFNPIKADDERLKQRIKAVEDLVDLINHVIDMKLTDIIPLINEQHMTYAQIAKRYNRTPITVNRWVAKLRKAGYAVLPHQGRPRLTIK